MSKFKMCVSWKQRKERGIYMKKRFNVTGICVPSLHYMADTSAIVDQIITE